MSNYAERDGRFDGLEAVSQVLSEDNEKRGFIQEISKRHGLNSHKLKERSDFLAEFMRNNDISLDENPSIHSQGAVGEQYDDIGVNEFSQPRNSNKSNFTNSNYFNPSQADFNNRGSSSIPDSFSGVHQIPNNNPKEEYKPERKAANGNQIIKSIDNLFENMRNKYNLQLNFKDEQSQLIESRAKLIDQPESKELHVHDDPSFNYDSNVESILARVRTTMQSAKRLFFPNYFHHPAHNKGGSDQNSKQQLEATLRQEKEFEKRKEDISKKFGIAMTDQGQKMQINEDERNIQNQILSIRSKARNGQQRDGSTNNKSTELSPVSEKEKKLQTKKAKNIKNVLFKDSSSSSNSSENESSKSRKQIVSNIKGGKQQLHSKQKTSFPKGQRDKSFDELEQLTQNKPNFKENIKKLKQLYKNNFNKTVEPPPEIEQDEKDNSDQENDIMTENIQKEQYSRTNALPVKEQNSPHSNYKRTSPNVRSPSPILKSSTTTSRHANIPQRQVNNNLLNDPIRGRSPLNRSGFDKSEDLNTYSFDDGDIQANNESDVFNISPDHSTRLAHHQMIAVDDRNLSGFNENQSLQASFLDSSLLNPQVIRNQLEFSQQVVTHPQHSGDIPSFQQRTFEQKPQNIMQPSSFEAQVNPSSSLYRNESELNYSQSQQEESQIFQFRNQNSAKTEIPKNNSQDLIFSNDPVLIRLNQEKEDLLKELKYWEEQLNQIDNEESLNRF